MTGRLLSAAFAAITCLMLTACGIQTFDVGSGFPSDEAAYLRDLQEPDYTGATSWVSNDMSKADRAGFVQLGHAICASLASGTSIAQIDDTLREQFPNAPEVISLPAAAQKHLCPST